MVDSCYGLMAIIQIPTGSQSQPLDVPAALRNFSMSQKEKALEELVRDGWLSNVDDKIGFGIRSFLDFRSWFHNNDIPSCEGCNEALVKVSFIYLVIFSLLLPISLFFD